jgi:hypothetical protein
MVVHIPKQIRSLDRGSKNKETVKETKRKDDIPVTKYILFCVLTYNIHGLPWFIAQDNPEERAAKIGESIEYNIALLQEDFWYQEALDETAPHTYTVRETENRWFTIGSGLTTLTTYPVIYADIVHFNICNGWIGNEFDCWADKGFMLTRLLVEGREVDVYNTHLDAGDSEDDVRTRQNQLTILSGYIRRHSEERPVIVGGDFNLTTKELFNFAMTTNLNLFNVDDDYIDHIMFRDLDAGGYGEDLNLEELSDHPGIVMCYQLET